ncbi:hypothetical protein CVIRNUC_006665 [Coccomyxa viridis]|uniref:[RNA-polymerase]-subunit kinase n=1 Tax=Coccomyxa viridis TaxID=1274662 RepID=A0AAV1I7Y6_9CHLO|nr:hypothetical protein CVIRNUC_006665 [Coccomyxa viridis]
MEHYEKGEKLGQGQFGVVIKARHIETGQIVAIKKIHLGNAKEGINMTALREIKLLREIDNPFIVRLLDVFPHKRNLSLVYEYMDSDLECLIRDRATIISPADVKSYMQMVLQSLLACKQHWVLHRDIKPSNFLISMQGGMKLTDFGLARMFGSPESGRYTHQVFTRWYRPPELLFGSTCYGPACDMWAAGCIFAELLLRRAWFPGDTDLDQLGKIFQALGTPSQDSWPGCACLPQYVEFQTTTAPPLRNTFRQASEDALALLALMVALDPGRRISVEDALAHPYFRADPKPTLPEQLPKPPVRAHNPLNQSFKGGSVLQAAPAVHSEDAGPAGDLNGKALHLEPASAAVNGDGVPNQKRLKIENGDYSSIASLSEGEELHEKIRPGNLSGDLQKQVSADELKALQEIGFEAGSTRHIISHGDQRLKKRKLNFDEHDHG